MNQQGTHVAVVVAEEALSVHAKHALAAFFVSRRGAHDEAPLRPWVFAGAHSRRLRHDLELRDRCSTLAQRRAEAVGTGVAAADNDHVLARRIDRRISHVALLHAVG